MSPSLEEGFRRLSFSLGFFVGGSWDVLELDLVVLADGKTDAGAFATDRDERMPASLYLRVLAAGSVEVK